MSLLTKKQKEVLDFVEEYNKKNHITPTIKEVADYFRVSTTAIHNHFDQLVRRGYLEKTPNLSRSVRIRRIENKGLSVSIPLLGMVGAGYGVDLYEENEPVLVEVPALWLNPSQKNTYYCLQVDGFSMTEDGVLNGDIIVVKEQKGADDGDSVVAYIKDTEEVTLKRFYKRRNKIELRPKNTSPQYKSRLIEPENLEIKGKFIGLLRVS